LDAYKHRKRKIMVHDMRKASAFEALPVRRFAHQTRAYLKVQDGCNQFCSYCIIPYARGVERSLAPEEVIKAAKELVCHGHKEIVLTGIHTGRYGKEYHVSLTQLLQRLCEEVHDLQRIRISSIEMNEVSDELIALMKKEKKIARHLHIPIQCANNAVLKAMNRPYTVEEYARRIAQIRREVPRISISSDVITGFPGESEAQFLQGMEELASMRLSFLHVFPFSKRDGTKAAKMSHQWDQKTKKQRCAKLMELSKSLYHDYKCNFLNEWVDVLWEREENGMMFGHTSEYLGVYAPLDHRKLHTMETLKIVSYEDDLLLCSSQEVSG